MENLEKSKLELISELKIHKQNYDSLSTPLQPSALLGPIWILRLEKVILDAPQIGVACLIIIMFVL